MEKNNNNFIIRERHFHEYHDLIKNSIFFSILYKYLFN